MGEGNDRSQQPGFHSGLGARLNPFVNSSLCIQEIHMWGMHAGRPEMMQTGPGMGDDF